MAYDVDVYELLKAKNIEEFKTKLSANPQSLFYLMPSLISKNKTQYLFDIIRHTLPLHRSLVVFLCDLADDVEFPESWTKERYLEI